jgi:hypothetical protein
MTPAEAVALSLALLLIAGVLGSSTIGTRTGVFMLASGLLAIVLVVFHQWSR